MIASWREIYDKSRQCVEKQRHYFSDKGLYSQGYGLPSGHERLWELGCKESRVTKNWCLWTVVLEKIPESPLDNKEIKQVNLKGNRPWILLGRTNAESKTPVFWSSDVNSWLIEKVPDAGKDWGHKERRASGWDGWMASLMQWTWTWANSERWWQTGRPGMLQWVGVAELDMTGWLNNNKTSKAMNRTRIQYPQIQFYWRLFFLPHPQYNICPSVTTLYYLA